MSFQNHPRGSDPVAHLWHIVMCSSGSCLTVGETRFRFLHDASSGPPGPVHSEGNGPEPARSSLGRIRI